MKNYLVAIELINVSYKYLFSHRGIPRGLPRIYFIGIHGSPEIQILHTFLQYQACSNTTPECYLVEASDDVRKARHDEIQIERFTYLDPCNVAGFVAVLLLLFLLLLLSMQPLFFCEFNANFMDFEISIYSTAPRDRGLLFCCPALVLDRTITASGFVVLL